MLKSSQRGHNMKNILGSLLILGLLTACASTSSASYHKISAEEAKTKMSEETVIIVDVRTQEEYDAGHIENAMLIPNESISGEPTELPDKDAVILVYCRSGNRSKQASDKLVDLGYTQVYDFGGIIDWPYAVVQ